MDERIHHAIQALTEAQRSIDELTRALSDTRSDTDLSQRALDAGLMMPDELLIDMSSSLDVMIDELRQLDE